MEIRVVRRGDVPHNRWSRFRRRGVPVGTVGTPL